MPATIPDSKYSPLKESFRWQCPGFVSQIYRWQCPGFVSQLFSNPFHPCENASERLYQCDCTEACTVKPCERKREANQKATDIYPFVGLFPKNNGSGLHVCVCVWWGLAMKPRLALNSWPSCLNLLSDGITGQSEPRHLAQDSIFLDSESQGQEQNTEESFCT